MAQYGHQMDFIKYGVIALDIMYSIWYHCMVFACFMHCYIAKLGLICTEIFFPMLFCSRSDPKIHDIILFANTGTT